MWGSTFSDLARKAQELQEQAQEAASTFTAPSAAAGLFNLDAMRQGEEEARPPTKPISDPVEVPVPPPPRATSKNPLMDHKLLSATAPKPVRSPATPVGRLKVPAPSSSASQRLSPAQQHSTASSPPAAAAASTATSPEQSQPNPPASAASSLSSLHPPLTEPVEAEATTPPLAEPPLASGAEQMEELLAVSDARGDRKEGGVLAAEKDVVAVVDADADAPDPPRRDQQHCAEPAEAAAGSESSLGAPVSDSVARGYPEVAVDSDEAEKGEEEPAMANGTSHESEVIATAFEDCQQDSAEEGDVARSSSPMNPLSGPSIDGVDVPSSKECDDDQSGSDGPAVRHLPLEASGNESHPDPGIVDAPSVGHCTTKQGESDRSFGGANAAPSALSSALPVPDHVLEQFSRQMQRLDENFQAERAEMQRRFQLELQQARDTMEASSRELEDALRAEIRDKDEQLHELARRNEGLKLKMDVLKREVTGTQALLEAKDGDMGKVNADNRRALEDLERKLAEAQRETFVAQRKASDAQARLESAETDFNTLKQEHIDLKGRVKAVATELKDRRIECRELKSVIDQKGEENENLEREVERLRFQLSEKEKTGGEKHEEMEQLRADVIDLRAALEASRKVISENEERAEKVLSEYKRKAQNSLALANSRAASAVQAKEEAELEARAARSTADSAMEKAVAAELSSIAAIAETKAMLKHLETEKNEAFSLMTAANNKLALAERKLQETETKLNAETSMHQQATEALTLASNELIEVKSRMAILEAQLEQSQVRCNSLRDDVATLRQQLKKAEAAGPSAESDGLEAPVVKQDRNAEIGRPPDDSTVRILQEDLREANKAIEQLKEALASSLALTDSHEMQGIAHPRGAGSESNGDSSSTPLFYAMEKQAELNTARDEIMRLANLLSDVQSEKTEAIELKEEMRQRMEDAEARLRRYEKLGHASNGASSNGAPANSGSTNIEYLKNIMLRYLNAKTHAEKKSLVPVIGAVLCLTQDEQNAAIRTLDESASLGGVGSSIFDSIGLKLK